MSAIESYKIQLKALLSPSERKQLQGVLTQFVEDKSFDNLRVTLPVVLNTPAKRQMCHYIRNLIPDKYLEEYDSVVAKLPPLAEGSFGAAAAAPPPLSAPMPPPRDPPPPPPRASLASPPGDGMIHTYINWGALDNLDSVKSLEFTEHDALLYENCRQLMDETRSRMSGSGAVSRHGSASSAFVSRGSGDSAPVARAGTGESGPFSRTSTGDSAAISRAGTGESVRRSDKAWARETYMVGNITRQHSEALLQQHGGTDGLFLVRSKDGDLCHVVSVVYKGAPLHLLVERGGVEEAFKVNGETFGQCFRVEDIVERMRAFGSRFEYQLIKPLFL